MMEVTAVFRYDPPLRDIRFVLHELLEVEPALHALPGSAAWDRATIDQTI